MRYARVGASMYPSHPYGVGGDAVSASLSFPCAPCGPNEPCPRCLCSPAVTFRLTSRLAFQTAETTTLYHACCYATVVVSEVYFILTEQLSLYSLHQPQKLAQPPY
jgi:hypothetical protein